MYSKREVVEFDIPRGNERLRFSHASQIGEVYVQLVYADGFDTDDLMTISKEELTDVIEVLKEIRGY